MKKIQLFYFLVPGIALAIFYTFYHGFNREYQAAAVAKEAAAKAAHIEAMKEEARLREVAIKEALALNAQRRAEREIREAAELARKEARTAAEDALELALSERKRLRDRVAALEDDVVGVEDEIESITADQVRLTGELEFLREFVTEAENNRQDFERVIQDIRQAEEAHAAALLAAADAKK